MTSPPAAGADQPAAGVEKQYDLGGLWAAITVMFGWQVIAVLPLVIACWTRYGLVASGAVIWLAYMVIGAISARIVLRGGGREARLRSHGSMIAAGAQT